MATTTKRCPKWSADLKAGFRRHIEARRINPKRCDKEYIKTIHQLYYKDRPLKTFEKNYKTSIAEYRAGQAINAAHKARGKSDGVMRWTI